MSTITATSHSMIRPSRPSNHLDFLPIPVPTRPATAFCTSNSPSRFTDFSQLRSFALHRKSLNVHSSESVENEEDFEEWGTEIIAPSPKKFMPPLAFDSKYITAFQSFDYNEAKSDSSSPDLDGSQMSSDSCHEVDPDSEESIMSELRSITRQVPRDMFNANDSDDFLADFYFPFKGWSFDQEAQLVDGPTSSQGRPKLSINTQFGSSYDNFPSFTSPVSPIYRPKVKPFGC